MKLNNILNKFEIDTKDEKLWYYILEGSNEVKKIIDEDLRGDGQFNYQIFYQLDRENKDHWINYTITHSHGKTWLNLWYKKRVESIKGGKVEVDFMNYKKKVEKTGDLINVEFTNKDEWIKITNPNELDGKYKEKGYRWVNRYDWQNK